MASYVSKRKWSEFPDKDVSWKKQMKQEDKGENFNHDKLYGMLLVLGESPN